MKSKGKQTLLSALIALGVALADQLIKHAVRRTAFGSVLLHLPGILELTHCVNTGAAFSMLEGKTLLSSVLSAALLAALAFILLFGNKTDSTAAIAIGALMGGGLGNLADRVVFGGVTDYIRLLFIRFPVFNLADICITCSILYLAVLLFTGRLDPFGEKP